MVGATREETAEILAGWPSSVDNQRHSRIVRACVGLVLSWADQFPDSASAIPISMERLARTLLRWDRLASGDSG